MQTPFSNVVGTPSEPLFAEVVFKGHSIQSNGLERPFVNILHFRRTTNSDNSDEAELQTAVIAALEPTLSAALSVFYVGDTVDVRFMDDPTRAAVEFSSDINGTVADDRQPNFDAIVTRKICQGARGRSYKGSNHWGPIAESSTTKDTISTAGLIVWNAFQAAMDGVTTTWLTLPGGDVWRMIVLSPTLSNLVASPSIFSGAYVTGVTLNTTLGSMRRRKERGGVA